MIPVIAIDTEGTPAKPWCLSFALQSGEAHVVRTAETESLRIVQGLIDEGRLVIGHNMLWDLPVLRKLGITVPEGQFTDTMLMAWLLGFEFIGLKKLAGMLLGKDRDSYRDVMEEANERIAREWLTEQIIPFPRWPGAKPPDIEKTFRLIDRMLAKPEGTRTLRERWHDCRAREVLQEDLQMVGEMPEATLDDVPLADAIDYACEDADDTLRIYAELDNRIDAMGLRDVLNVDLAVVPMICRMQEVGIKADAQHFRDLSALYEHELQEIAGQIRDMGGPDNPGCDEIKDWLFKDLGLPTKKKTKKGAASTDKKALEAILKNPKIQGRGRQGLELLMEWRQVRKLKTTYSDPMPDFIAADGRLHPNLSLTTVPTGRLAAKKPNVLAFPKHSERGKLIRAGFVADEGCELGEWDLSQIEMCIMAIDSGDERMLGEINSGVDKHTATAAMIFGKDVKKLAEELEAKDPIAKEQRFAAKAVNFGILMGITEYGLLDQFLKQGSIRGKETRYNRITEQHEGVTLPWTLSDCKDLLLGWHEGYPQASAYIYAKHEEAKRTGYVRDIWNRIRYIEDITSQNDYFFEQALRQAQATPIQSGAQGLVKRWMRSVWKRLPVLWNEGLRAECLLQAHDALLCEYQKELRQRLHNLMQDALDDWQMFPIQIKLEGTFGQRWSEL